MPFDVKKEFKDLYAPKPGPRLVTVPPARFIAVRGQGDPNDPQGEYARAVPMLYAVIYTIKMSKMGSRAIAGFEDFVVPPLEGLWWMPGIAGVDYARKERFNWISMIRLPDFADDEVVAWAKAEARSKKDVDASLVEVFPYDEGLCVQCLHEGPYDDEPATLDRMMSFMREEGCRSDFSQRHHHEIYLSDPRRTEAGKLRTIIRHPVIRTEGET